MRHVRSRGRTSPAFPDLPCACSPPRDRCGGPNIGKGRKSKGPFAAGAPSLYSSLANDVRPRRREGSGRLPARRGDCQDDQAIEPGVTTADCDVRRADPNARREQRRPPKHRRNGSRWGQGVPGHGVISPAAGGRLGGGRGCRQLSKVWVMRMRLLQHGQGGSGSSGSSVMGSGGGMTFASPMAYASWSSSLNRQYPYD